MWYIYTMEYYSAIERNKIESFVEMWMDLETVIQSEVSRKEKNKYRILMHICGIQKKGTDEPVCRAEVETDLENKCMDTKGGKPRWGGDGGVLNWVIGIDMYTLMCIKLMISKNLLYKK